MSAAVRPTSQSSDPAVTLTPGQARLVLWKTQAGLDHSEPSRVVGSGGPGEAGTPSSFLPRGCLEVAIDTVTSVVSAKPSLESLSSSVTAFSAASCTAHIPGEAADEISGGAERPGRGWSRNECGFDRIF